MSASHSIQSILVATDLSDRSAEAVKGAAEIAAATGAGLHVVHAYEEPSVLSGASREVLDVQRAVHEKRIELHEFVQSLLPSTAKVDSVRVEFGSAAEVVLKDVQSRGIDLVVLGPHRDRGFADRMLGSTAESVLRHAPVPCLIVNGPLSLPLDRILVPVDFSPSSRAAVATALQFADQVSKSTGEASVTVAHVAEPGMDLAGLPTADERNREDLLATASEASREAGVDRRVETALLRGGDPSEELLVHADEAGTQMIVMSTQGESALVRALLGSVSSALVRRSPVPLLLVPRRAGPRQPAPERAEMPTAIRA